MSELDATIGRRMTLTKFIVFVATMTRICLKSDDNYHHLPPILPGI